MSKDREIKVSFTEEEAWELLSRCLNSSEVDGDVSREALRKLASAIKSARTRLKLAS